MSLMRDLRPVNLFEKNNIKVKTQITRKPEAALINIAVTRLTLREVSPDKRIEMNLESINAFTENRIPIRRIKFLCSD